ncbi:phosphodiester glycosidase family protein [Paenibacillus tyrfis]|uniref:phosphodiester glycosidase family protein n=1 Tax=Paenibacillus tyrfis TaxID=1501230 RepID=UPI0015C60661|nr:phosphodiester glycosidase family protein [Paenibacillus tyrfis]
MKKRFSIIMALTVLLSFVIPHSSFAGIGGPTSYKYSTYSANNVKLNVIQTSPGNIQLKALNLSANLENTSYIGINGGFFSNQVEETTSMKKTHNIAINNGKPVIGTDKAGNNGWYNSGNQGTIIWDAKNGKFLFKVLNNGWEVNKAVGHNNYWAQGGVSMSLGSTSWKDTITKEKLPNPDGKVQRTAMVYSGTGIYLIVTDTKCTAEAFRGAIQQYFGIKDGSPKNDVNGIFLDGSGSSQMRAYDNNNKLINIKGDSRALHQIVTVTP